MSKKEIEEQAFKVQQESRKLKDLIQIEILDMVFAGEPYCTVDKMTMENHRNKILEQAQESHLRIVSNSTSTAIELQKLAEKYAWWE